MTLETSTAVVTMCVLGAASRLVGRLSRWLDERTKVAALRAQSHLNRDAFVRELRKERPSWPGDTDAEFFEGYTPEQLEWVTTHGEELDCIKHDRYCDPETGEVRS